MFLSAQTQWYTVFKDKNHKDRNSYQSWMRVGVTLKLSFLAEHSNDFRHNMPVILVNTSGPRSRPWKSHMCCWAVMTVGRRPQRTVWANPKWSQDRTALASSFLSPAPLSQLASFFSFPSTLILFILGKVLNFLTHSLKPPSPFAMWLLADLIAEHAHLSQRASLSLFPHNSEGNVGGGAKATQSHTMQQNSHGRFIESGVQRWLLSSSGRGREEREGLALYKGK